ncbi:hypothetical protein LA080_011289 [Diaporthe eres]|nr:hypothetical protein LA080_011289 [Diaporthe eres]
MAQAPVSAGNVPPPPPNSPPVLFPARPPVRSLDDPQTSTDFKGDEVRWSWRCEDCGHLSCILRGVIVEDRARIRQRVAHTRPVLCAYCEQPADWKHLSSEIQVNRALKAPHEFLYADTTDDFSQLRAQDWSDDALRILDPAEGLQDEAVEWMRVPYSLTYRGSQGAFGQSPTEAPKYFLRQIRAITTSASGGENFWDNVNRVLA